MNSCLQNCKLGDAIHCDNSAVIYIVSKPFDLGKVEVIYKNMDGSSHPGGFFDKSNAIYINKIVKAK